MVGEMWFRASSVTGDFMFIMSRGADEGRESYMFVPYSFVLGTSALGSVL